MFGGVLEQNTTISIFSLNIEADMSLKGFVQHVPIHKHHNRLIFSKKKHMLIFGQTARMTNLAVRLGNGADACE